MICTDSTVEMERIAAQAIALGAGHTAELVLAASRGEIALTALAVPGSAAPMKFLRRAVLPTIAIIGDDAEDTNSARPAGSQLGA